MTTKDIHLYESGSGGQLALLNGDISLTEVLYNQFYLALFGGNYEASTIGNEINGQGRQDYWGNSLFFSENKVKQFNSQTERVLNNVALNSSGRLEIERAVNEDLAYMKSLVNFTVNVYFDGVNKVVIEVKFSKKTDQEQRVLQLVYDNAKNELIIDRII